MLFIVFCSSVFAKPNLILYDAEVRSTDSLLNARESFDNSCAKFIITGTMVKGNECSATVLRTNAWELITRSLIDTLGVAIGSLLVTVEIETFCLNIGARPYEAFC